LDLLFSELRLAILRGRGVCLCGQEQGSGGRAKKVQGQSDASAVFHRMSSFGTRMVAPVTFERLVGREVLGQQLDDSKAPIGMLRLKSANLFFNTPQPDNTGPQKRPQTNSWLCE
jgi:hypothetical protein